MKNIAFDVGGVLMDIATNDDVKQGAFEFLKNEIKVDKNDSELKNIVDVCIPAWFSELDTGLNIWSKFFSKDISSQIVNQYKYFHAHRYQPSEVLFIDDKIENVQAAKDFGMTSLLFTTQSNLENDLSNLSLFKPTHHKQNSD